MCDTRSTTSCHREVGACFAVFTARLNCRFRCQSATVATLKGEIHGTVAANKQDHFSQSTYRLIASRTTLSLLHTPAKIEMDLLSFDLAASGISKSYTSYSIKQTTCKDI